MGYLVKSGLTSFASECGGGHGEYGVGVGVPADACEGERSDDQSGLVEVESAMGDRLGGFRGVDLDPPVRDAGASEFGEGDGVAACFGKEVAAEAEHVRPPTQPGVVVR